MRDTPLQSSLACPPHFQTASITYELLHLGRFHVTTPIKLFTIKQTKYNKRFVFLWHFASEQITNFFCVA